MVDYGRIRQAQIIALAPKWLNDLYKESRKNPHIIHYAGPEKPWLYPEMDFGIEFWKYAKKSPYYECMLSRMVIHYSTRACETNHRPTIKSGIQCVRDHGVPYTVKYGIKKLKGG